MTNVNEYGLSNEILNLLVETGTSATEDLEALRAGRHTEASLLGMCLAGCEDSERESLWREYVSRMVSIA